ncbi:hypothetical protein HanRHA438_Chr06g0280401 [Helianthus annuus]|nr:hypothetical protein HanRHA438_Chr06g0280401 [Helianthus annuus]
MIKYTLFVYSRGKYVNLRWLDPGPSTAPSAFSNQDHSRMGS